jgi:hypothetical protein
MTKKYPPTRDLRDIGRVVPFVETMDAARESSSCCVGVEAALETKKGMNVFINRLSNSATLRRSDKA